MHSPNNIIAKTVAGMQDTNCRLKHTEITLSMKEITTNVTVTDF